MAQPLLRQYAYGIDPHVVVAVCRNVVPDVVATNVFTVLSTTELTHGEPFDLLVTLTGRTADMRVGPGARAAWDGVIADTLTSVYDALANVPVKDGGNVVVVGSVVGSTGGYGCANYAAAKAGLVGLVRSAALEWAGRGVCVNLLELGFMDAGMGARLPPKVRDRALPTIPLGRFGTEAEFVHAVEFLSTVRYMTGSVLTLAGGLR